MVGVCWSGWSAVLVLFKVFFDFWLYLGKMVSLFLGFFKS